MWVEVERLAQQESLTILLTTHYLEEADRLAERVAIVSQGTVVVEGKPDELKANLRGELVTVELGDEDGRIEEAAAVVRTLDGASEVTVDGRHVRARVPNGAQAIPSILAALEGPAFRRVGDHGPPVARRRLPPLHGPRLRDRGRRRRLIQLLRQTGWMVVRQLREPDARADLDRDDGDPAAHLAAPLRAALLARRRAARRRVELHRVPRRRGSSA